MIPLSDSVVSRRQPVVTVAFIVACCLVFLYELTLRGSALDAFVRTWGAVPRVVLGALAGDPRSPRQELVTLFTSQFIHAGLLHLGGNMLFLWVFGRAVEDRVGSPLFFLFYLVAGALAGLVQSIISGGDSLPMIGASGAIAGVLGLYFVAYPSAWVRVLVPVLFFFWTFDLPAIFVLAFWFVGQFFSGIAAITQASSATGDVAVWAHIAGFALGALSAPILPHTTGSSPVGAGPSALRRSDAPGPARLVSSVADLAAVLLAARLAVRFFGLSDARPPIGGLAAPILAVTQPVVSPLQALLPTLRVLGGALETSTLAVIVAIYLIAGLISQLFLRR